VEDVAAWCPACRIEGLDTYLSILKLAYKAPPLGPAQTVADGADRRPIAGSGYLGAVVPHSSQLASILNAAFIQTYQRGTDLLVAHRYPDAIGELRAALTWNPESAEAHNNLGIALASAGRMDEALTEFKQALTIDPGFDDARRNLSMATSPEAESRGRR
jgi:tetratricopeptide (TPR) repeat protein